MDQGERGGGEKEEEEEQEEEEEEDGATSVRGPAAIGLKNFSDGCPRLSSTAAAAWGHCLKTDHYAYIKQQRIKLGRLFRW